MFEGGIRTLADRKKLIATANRREGACNRTGEPSVTFCEREGARKRADVFLAKKNGAKYTINVLKEDLVEKVKEYTFGHGTTVSIDSACTKDSLINLLQATGNAGRVMTMGFSTAPTEINQFVITSKELDVRGSRLQNKMFGKAIEMINAGTLDLSNSISHTFPLTKAQEAFDFVDSRDPSIRKIVFTFDNL